jgi:hypothetical protein
MSHDRDNLSLLKKGIQNKVTLAEVTGVSGSALAYLLSQLLSAIDHTCLIILPGSEEAGVFYRDLDFFVPNQNNKRVLLFPPYNISPLTGLSPPKDRSALCSINYKRYHCCYIIGSDYGAARAKRGSPLFG